MPVFIHEKLMGTYMNFNFAIALAATTLAAATLAAALAAANEKPPLCKDVHFGASIKRWVFRCA